MSNAFFDQPLPHDTAAEQAIIGIMLTNGDALREIVAELSPDAFFSNTHRELFALMAAEVSAGAVGRDGFDPIAIRNVIHRAKARIWDVTRTDGEVDAEIIGLAQSAPTLRWRTYAEIVRQMAQRRTLISESYRLATAAFDVTPTAADALATDAISRISKAVVEKSVSQESAHFADFLGVMDEPAAARVRTGIPLVDDMCGGFPRGALSIVAAKTSVGKTAFGVTCAFEHADQAEGTSLFVSAEMPKREITMRFACLAARLSYTRWERGGMSVGDREILLSWAQKLQRERRIAIFDCSEPTIGRVAVEVARAVEKLGVSIVFVDYLQLLRPNPGEEFDRRELAVHSVSKGLLTIAKRHDIPVVAMCQLNEDGQTRESRGIEMDANVVIRLDAPDMEREWSMREFVTERSITAIVKKNRGGRIGACPLTMLTGPMRFISEGVSAAAQEQAAEAEAQARMTWGA